MANKVDSNLVGLRFAEESSYKVVSGSAVWYQLEPNSYADFGARIATVARNPINAARQRNKGVVTDLDASGGFTQDITLPNSMRLLQGFFFADAREKPTTAPITGAAGIAMTATTTTTYTAAAGLNTAGFLAQHLVFGSGFTNVANNGLHLITAVAAGSLTTTGLVVETPPAAAMVQAVGYEFAAATLDVVMTGNLPALHRASGVFDFTTLGLVPGEFIFVGGDVVLNQFANNLGWARVKSVTSTDIFLDKTNWTPVGEVGTGKNIRIFFGTVLKNESNPALIKRRTYQLERTLGNDANGTMSEYLVGAVPNELNFDFSNADKVTGDFSFVGADVEQRTGLIGVKAGTRPSITTADAFNTVGDMTRIRVSVIDQTLSAMPALAFAESFSIKISNNVSAVKALAVLGALDAVAGTFAVDGRTSLYFADMTGVQAVRNGADITVDVILAKKNQSFVLDVPQITLGDGRLGVEQDRAIMLPFDLGAAVGTLGHTLMCCMFPYSPTAAE